ncbi:glycosyltransferase [Phycisphaera mikurensis]|uniref:Glycosyltransferase n=1 Tax=Phycisphaera mikurensis (strain NBRC 102666 / KCTC 22515 / FYK2301M01) TaxID=1142394 RepID=I0IEH7_PHYMF|nr:glycosyltransferase [Phycisphaera mikurensis]MBB6441464.1 cellulose synthase/poly-beta-1,6-N-acetylglucosamine synthase-like glycosyltransferase [Phycisphaera mikurensis]BAM03665.1 hypothetical protein PSMK_15060 [Phycisphaera mikurensis NBRC 102666]
MLPLPLQLVAAAVLAGWCLQALLGAMQVRRFSKRLRRGERPSYAAFRPEAWVVVPFKGVDDEGVANLHALFQQDYGDYRLLLAVESEEDPAFRLLNEERAKFPRIRSEVVVAGPAPPFRGQKVHNQLAALRHALAGEGLDGPRPAPPRYRDERAWVFADSDAAANPAWLGNLVGPLSQRDKNAVTTGYRWLVPARGPGGRFRWGGRIASVINGQVATFASLERAAFAWGGSMAILEGTAEAGGLLERWERALSDDFQVTAVARSLGRRILFLPECLVESPVDMPLRSLLEFSRRQYLITRVHAPRFFYAVVAAVGFYVFAAASAWLLLLAAPWHRVGWLAAGAAAALLFVAGANRVRAAARRRVVRGLFGQQTAERLAPALRLDRWATTAVMALNLVLLLRGCVGRTIRWRGHGYRLRGPMEIERLSA